MIHYASALLPFILFTSFASDARSVKLKRAPHRIDVVIGGRPFTTFYFSPEVSKPYLMPLQTPSGIVVTRDFPIGNDVAGADTKDPSFEPHQRPLYFAHGNVDGLDYWSEEVFDPLMTDHGHQAYGHMVLKELEQADEAQNQATVRARFRLLDPGGRQVAEETQSFTFRGDERTRTIDCEFIVFATHGPVVFGDIKEGTFGIRLNRELSAPNDHMLNSQGGRGEPAIWGKRADWVSYSGTVAGKPVGVAIFDSPLSFRHPAYWMARAYGLFAANPFGLRKFSGDDNQDGSWTVPEGRSLRFRYRVVLYDGELTFEELAEMYRGYAAEK